MSVPYVKTVSSSTLPEEIVILLLYYLLIVSFLPSKSMTIGTLLEDNVDRSRTASLDSSAVVVEAVVVANVVEAGVVETSWHS